MSRLFTVVDTDGVVVCHNITRDECFALRGLERQPDSAFLVQVRGTLVTPRKSQPYVWVACVVRTVILDAVRKLRGLARKLQRPAATGGWQVFSNATCSGRRYEHNFKVSYGYRTTVRCAGEHIIRNLMPKALAA